MKRISCLFLVDQFNTEDHLWKSFIERKLALSCNHPNLSLSFQLTVVVVLKGGSILEQLLIITPRRLNCLQISIQEGRNENFNFCSDQTTFIDVEICIVFLLLRNRSDTEESICWADTWRIYQLQIRVCLWIYTQKFLSCLVFQPIQSVDNDWSALESLYLLDLPATESHLLICFFRVNMYSFRIFDCFSFLWIILLILVFIFFFVLILQRIANSVLVKFFLVN